MRLDPRTTLARPDLADVRLQGIVAANRYADPVAARCCAPSTGVCSAPDAAAELTDQLLFGEPFDVLERQHRWAWGQARRDGYVGYVRDEALEDGVVAPTHRVSALRAYALAEPDLKAPALGLYSLNALMRVDGRSGRFLHAPDAGWFVDSQLAPIGELEAEPAAIAERFIGAPYRWGGRESLGLDCSGLVQAALHACGLACPRDSDQQFDTVGHPVAEGALRRGDLVFWDGHVGMMLDAARLLHASGDWAAVVAEPLADAVARRLTDGRGAPIGYRRP